MRISVKMNGKGKNMRGSLAVALLAFAPLLWAGELTIVKDGKSDYVIAVPGDKAEARKIREAAEALQGYLEKSTGVKLKMVREGDVEERPAFYLGRTKKGEAVGVPYVKLVEYVNCRKVVGKDIFLAGNDESLGLDGPLQYHDREYLGILEGINTHVKDLSYRRLHGTLKAVLGWLEGENVVQFLLPGENGRNIVPHPTLKVRDDLDWTGSNAFPFSNGRCYGDLHTTIALGHTDIPFYKHWGGHTFPVAVPRSKYEKDHPEYFILKDGKRRPDFGPANGGHLCVSNPEVQDLVLAELKRQYGAGYRWIQLGPTDGQVACECEACKKLHPDPRERQWLCYKAICEKAEKVIPDAKIVILSYGLSRAAPKSFDRMPSNVVLEMCIWLEDFDEKFADWARFKDVPKVSYVYFFGDYHSTAYGPTMAPSYVAKCLRILKANNAKGVFKCGWADDLGLDGPVNYAFSRLLEDPDRDEMALVDEFCDRAYASAAEPMKRFFRMMYGNMNLTGGRPVIYEMLQKPQCPERMFEAEFRPWPVTAMGRVLAQAEGAKDPDPKVCARLALVRRSYDFLNIRMRCYALNEAWDATHEPAILEIADRVFDERERMLDAWYDENGRMKPLDGFDWAYMHNASRSVIVGGGGQVCPSFPVLFRFGKGGVKNLLEERSGRTSTAGNVLSGPIEYWEGFRTYAPAIVRGGEPPVPAKGVDIRGNDAEALLKSFKEFRKRYADYLVSGRMLGPVRFEGSVPDHVGGVFWLNADGKRRAAILYSGSEKAEKLAFRFPGANRPTTVKFGLCELQCVEEPR